MKRAAAAASSRSWRTRKLKRKNKPSDPLPLLPRARLPAEIVHLRLREAELEDLISLRAGTLERRISEGSGVDRAGDRVAVELRGKLEGHGDRRRHFDRPGGF